MIKPGARILVELECVRVMRRNSHDCPWPPLMAISWEVCGQGDSEGQGWENNAYKQAFLGLQLWPDCLMSFVLNESLGNHGHAFRILPYSSTVL